MLNLNVINMAIFEFFLYAELKRDRDEDFRGIFYVGFKRGEDYEWKKK